MGLNLAKKPPLEWLHLFCFSLFSFLPGMSFSYLIPDFPHSRIPWKVLTSASRSFSIFHCCSPRLREWAGSVFRSSCFSKVTAASYCPSRKSSGRNSPVSPLLFFFPVTWRKENCRSEAAGPVLGSFSREDAAGGPWSSLADDSHLRALCCQIPGWDALLRESRIAIR